MPIAAREYVSTRGLGDLVGCRQAMEAFASTVDDLNAGEPESRATFFARVLFSPADMEEECLRPTEVTAITGGVFPCLWVNITFDPDRLPLIEIAPIEALCQLQFLGDVRSEGTFR